MTSDEGVKKLVATFEAELAAGNTEQVTQDLKDLETQKPGMLKRIKAWCLKVAGKAGEKAATDEFKDLIETLTGGTATPPV